MNIVERDDFVDLVAQAVIDKIEERHRINQMVEMVVARVIELQQKEADLQAAVTAHGQTSIAGNPESSTASE